MCVCVKEGQASCQDVRSSRGGGDSGTEPEVTTLWVCVCVSLWCMHSCASACVLTALTTVDCTSFQRSRVNDIRKIFPDMKGTGGRALIHKLPHSRAPDQPKTGQLSASLVSHKHSERLRRSIQTRLSDHQGGGKYFSAWIV